ncbi:MAG: lamin tail domain-containing protein [Methanotrichaceae archaeon]
MLLASVIAVSGISIGAVMINEVELGPPEDSNEWVELYNSGEEDMDISYWSVWITNTLPSSGQWSGIIPIPKETTIQAKGFYVAEGDKRWDHRNNGTVILKTASGEVIDKTHFLTDDFGNVFTFSRHPNGKDTNQKSDWVFIKSTKYAENVLNGTY